MQSTLTKFFSFLLLVMSLSSSYAAPMCSNVFSNAVGTTYGDLHANGSTKLFNTEYNSNIIAVESISGGVTQICQGGTANCTLASHVSTITIPSSPSNGSNTPLQTNSNDAATSLSSNTSRSMVSISNTLNLNNNIYLNVKNNSGTAGSFTLNSSGKLNINGNVTLYAQDVTIDGTITINSGSLTIISSGKVTFNGSSNSTSDKLVILSSSTVMINSSIKAIIYSSGETRINGSGIVYGAVTASNIWLDGKVYYEPASISAANIPGCDQPTVNIGEREFALRNPIASRNIKGGLKVIGNTVLCVPNAYGNCYDYTGPASNAELNLKFIDVDGVTRTYNNSSQAILSIPSNATIKWAGVYTQGYLNNSNSNAVASILKDPVYITIPNLGTITSNPAIIDLYANGSDGYNYGTYASLDNLIGKKGNIINGTITAANIKANTGIENSGRGNLGAWVLVVVYEDTSSSLKNISVFDGYKQVSNNTGHTSVNITPSGFLTPSSGNVKSTLSLFVGEGDKNIPGDKLYVSNVAINDTNAFYSTLNGFTPIPNYSNTQGIDIQNHDIGKDGNTSHKQIIGNSATSATITLTSDQDAYFPSMVAFTTELYEPRVCYNESYYNADGNETVSTFNVGDIITVKSWIANMKIDASDSNLETAQKVEITLAHNHEYQQESTKIKNIGDSAYLQKTDASDSDIAMYDTNAKTSVWHVGVGANSTNGGDLTPNTTGSDTNKVFISYKTKFINAGETTVATYKVSYENSNMGMRIGDESPINIGICKSDFNSTIVVNPPLGIFNVVNSNFSGTKNSKISTSSDNALYTQTVSTPFNVKVLALDADYETLKAYTGDVNITLITTPNYLPSDTDEQKQAKCSSAIDLTPKTAVKFTNESSKLLSGYSYGMANKNVSFRIAYNNGGTKGYVCSRDSFAIRPDHFAVANIQNVLLTAGSDYNITLTAQDASNNAVSGYDQNVSYLKDFTPGVWLDRTTNTQINPNPIYGSFGTGIQKGSWAFNGTTGVAKTTVQFSDVGKFTVDINDTNWTIVDATDTLVQNRTISGNATLTFIPFDFNISNVVLHNYQDQTFTYLSDDLNMSAPISLTITARNAQGNTTRNYSNNLYEQRISLTPTLAPRNNVNANITAQLNQNLNFIDGTTTINWDDNNSIKFNFDRNASRAINPFDINASDLNITVVDTDLVRGDANGTGAGAVRFFYGRAYATDYSGASPLIGTIRYEVYCDTNCATFGLTTQSPLSLKWYQNPTHNSNDGNVTNFTSVGTTLVNNQQDTTSSGLITQGLEQITLSLPNGTNLPYTDRIILSPSLWLIYNPYNENSLTTDFTVTFTSAAAGWAGDGSLGKTVDINTSRRTNKRVEW